MATTQIFFASSLFGAATLAAAIDSGAFADADRRLLLISNNASNPETVPALDEAAGFERLRDRFDGLLSWNEAISPFHPAGWAPRGDDVPLWERHLRRLWGLGDDRIELAVESIQVKPALTIAQLFPDAALDVYADGLMSYGPTRNKIDPLVGERVRRLLHLDLVPGLKPLLLAEFGVEPQSVPAEAFVKVVGELSDAVSDACAGVPEGPALLLGQYLAELDILSPEQEEALHVRMLAGAAALGHRHVVFKPHPTAPAAWTRTLERRAESLGVELTVLDRPLLAEVLFKQLRPALVAGCFSTGLFTAGVTYGIPVARIGTEPLLERLTPYQNSNRVPLTIADALLPDLAAGEAGPPAGAGEELTGLLSAVGFAMQAQLRPDLRPAAEAFLRTGLDDRTARYFKRRRLTVLGLPGGVPVPRGRVARRVVGRGRRLKRVLKRVAARG